MSKVLRIMKKVLGWIIVVFGAINVAFGGMQLATGVHASKNAPATGLVIGLVIIALGAWILSGPKTSSGDKGTSLPQ